MRRTLLGSLLAPTIFIAGTLFLPCKALSFASGSDGKIPAPRIVSSFTAAPGASYPFRENMYRALQLPDGKIIALSIARKGGEQTMEARYSSDDGVSWSGAEDLFKWPRAEAGFGLLNALVDQTGEIHIWVLGDGNSGILFPKEKEAAPKRPGEILDIWYVRSRNGRTRWDVPRAIWRGLAGDLLSVIQLRSGRLLLPFTIQTSRSWSNRGGGFLDFTYFGSCEVSAMYSDDGGETWQTSPDILRVEPPDSSTLGAAEPVVLELKDGRVWMLIRTERGRFYQSFSSDGGVHWSSPQPTKLISSDSPAGLLRLKDGSILLFSNASQRYPYAYGGRYVLHVAISNDEGKTWRGFREVARDPLRNLPPAEHGDYGVSYTFPTLLKDSDVLFSNWIEEGPIRRFRLLDPRWIYEKRQESDFSKGIDDWSVFGSKGVDLIPDASNPTSKVLEVRKADLEWPAGAVWNFPVGVKGHLKMQLMVKPGFGGMLLGLTDYFSVPWDLDDQFNNVFNLRIPPSGRVLGTTLTPDRWYELDLAWDGASRNCKVSVDGKVIGQLAENRRTSGINYLRLRSIAEKPDPGVVIRAISADVSASWKNVK